MFASQVVDYGAKITVKRSKIPSFEFIKNPFKDFNPRFGQIKKIISRLGKRNLLILAIVILAVAGVLILKNFRTTPQSLIRSTSQTDFSPQNQATLNRKFEIPIRSASGKETGDKLAITFTTVDQAKRILIQGKPATARDTKAFLILNLEIDNSTTNQLTVRPVDFIRLVDSKDRSYAPDVHNNEVVAEPVSIKKTRVGFVVDENQENFKFLIGELNGNKEAVEVAI